MLNNYKLDQNGVIVQIERTKFNYDDAYINKAYGAAPTGEMSHLRFGYLCGSIGRIPTSVLDVGYGSGDFLKAAQKMVPQVYGYDIPPAFPVDGVTTVDGLYGRHYDVVTFFDSLEHFEDIYEIKDLDCNYVCISLPWCHYFSDEWFDTWKHRKPNEHLHHFNDAALVKFFDSIGYDVVNVCNIEDTIRRPNGDWKNILSGVFKRRK